MSQLLNIYNNSVKPRPSQARQIPGLETNVVDINNEFQVGFKNHMRRGLPTTFTSRALEYYDEELSSMVIPESFVPLDPSIPLNQWNPQNRYYIPGSIPGL